MTRRSLASHARCPSRVGGSHTHPRTPSPPLGRRCARFCSLLSVLFRCARVASRKARCEPALASRRAACAPSRALGRPKPRPNRPGRSRDPQTARIDTITFLRHRGRAQRVFLAFSQNTFFSKSEHEWISPDSSGLSVTLRVTWSSLEFRAWFPRRFGPASHFVSECALDREALRNAVASPLACASRDRGEPAAQRSSATARLKQRSAPAARQGSAWRLCDH